MAASAPILMRVPRDFGLSPGLIGGSRWCSEPPPTEHSGNTANRPPLCFRVYLENSVCELLCCLSSVTQLRWEGFPTREGPAELPWRLWETSSAPFLFAAPFPDLFLSLIVNRDVGQEHSPREKFRFTTLRMSLGEPQKSW